jgi:hypothetical protein
MKELEDFKFSSRIEVSDELANKLALIPNQSRAPIIQFYYAAAAIVLLISINVFAVLYSNHSKKINIENTEYFEEWT